MAHAGVVSVGVGVAATGVGKGGPAVHMLPALLDFDVEVRRIVDFLGGFQVNAADGVDELLHAGEVDLGIVRHLLLAVEAQVVHGLDHALGAIDGMGSVDLHGLALVDHTGVTRDRYERGLFLDGVDSRQDDRVGAIHVLARTAVRAEQEHVKRLASDVGIV